MRVLSVFILLFSLLSACSSNNTTDEPIVYVGKSDYWHATVNAQNDMMFELQFKGDDIQTVGDISFSVEIDEFGIGGSDYRVDENGYMEIKLDDLPPITKNSNVELTIQWDDSSEFIQLDKIP